MGCWKCFALVFFTMKDCALQKKCLKILYCYLLPVIIPQIEYKGNTVFEVSWDTERLTEVQKGVVSIAFYFSEIFKTISIYVLLEEIHSWA